MLEVFHKKQGSIILGLLILSILAITIFIYNKPKINTSGSKNLAGTINSNSDNKYKITAKKETVNNKEETVYYYTPLSLQKQTNSIPSHTLSLTPTIHINKDIPIIVSGESRDYTVILGEEQNFNVGNLKYIPDGHISKQEDEDGVLLFISALNKSYLVTGNSLDDASSFSSPLLVLSPEGDNFEKNYAGFGSIIRSTNNNSLIGLYHSENRINPDASDTQTSSIAVAISYNNGKTWAKKGKILSGMQELPPGIRTTGVGQPSAIIIGEYIYIYFCDWNGQMPNSIHVARSKISDSGLPGTWQKFYQGSFSQPGIGGMSDPVIKAFSFQNNIAYTSNPSISYNSFLQKYLMVFETNKGFYTAVSVNGIDWTNFRMFFQFEKDATTQKQVGDIWFSYPNFISPQTLSDQITTKKGYIFYSRGTFGNTHYLVRRPFELSY